MVVKWDPPLPDEDFEAYLSNAQAFLHSPTTTRAAIESGQHFHLAAVEFSQPAVGPAPFCAADELKERIDLAAKAQQAIRNAADNVEGSSAGFCRGFQLSLVQFSAFLCGDIDDLRYHVRWSSKIGLYNSLRSIEAILGHCQYLQFTLRVVFIRLRDTSADIAGFTSYTGARTPEHLDQKRKSHRRGQRS